MDILFLLNHPSDQETLPMSPVGSPTTSYAALYPADQLAELFVRHKIPKSLPLQKTEPMSSKLTIKALLSSPEELHCEDKYPNQSRDYFSVPSIVLVQPMAQDDHVHHSCRSHCSSTGEENSTGEKRKLKEKIFACEYCDAGFAMKSNLTRHIKMVHEKLKPFECDLCSLKFVQKSGLKRHVSRVHS